MSFDMTSIKTEPGSNGCSGALFEGLAVPADSAAVLKRSTPKGAPRVQSAVRNQVELRACDLDSALPADHQARAVWAFVQSLDLQALYAQIRAVEGSVGRAAIDPAILLSLWLYATLDGVGSARELDRLCDSDEAYRWLCGGWVSTTTRWQTSGSSTRSGWTVNSPAAWQLCCRRAWSA